MSVATSMEVAITEIHSWKISRQVLCSAGCKEANASDLEQLAEKTLTRHQARLEAKEHLKHRIVWPDGSLVLISCDLYASQG